VVFLAADGLIYVYASSSPWSWLPLGESDDLLFFFFFFFFFAVRVAH
jgi:hypothetical protein